MTEVRSTFLQAAHAGAALIAHPAVAAAWDRPSALAGLTVGDLTAHLARAGLLVQSYLGDPEGAARAEAAAPDAVLDAAGYYLAFPDLTDPASQLSQGVRVRAREGAVDGAAAVSERTTRTVAQLAELLPSLPAGQRITVKDGLVVTLDEYLRTRIVEFVVHGDDLVSSVPEPADLPGMPEPARLDAIDLLVSLALRRHGSLAVLRALSRRERDAVQALRVL